MSILVVKYKGKQREDPELLKGGAIITLKASASELHSRLNLLSTENLRLDSSVGTTTTLLLATQFPPH